MVNKDTVVMVLFFMHAHNVLCQLTKKVNLLLFLAWAIVYQSILLQKISPICEGSTDDQMILQCQRKISLSGERKFVKVYTTVRPTAFCILIHDKKCWLQTKLLCQLVFLAYLYPSKFSISYPLIDFRFLIASY